MEIMNLNPLQDTVLEIDGNSYQLSTKLSHAEKLLALTHYHQILYEVYSISGDVTFFKIETEGEEFVFGAKIMVRYGQLIESVGVIENGDTAYIILRPKENTQSYIYFLMKVPRKIAFPLQAENLEARQIII